MIEDKARELGRLIGQSSEYQSVKRASDALNRIQGELQNVASLTKSISLCFMRI